MTVENISWSISTKECCRPRRGWTRDLLVSSRTSHPTEPPRPAMLALKLSRLNLQHMHVNVWGVFVCCFIEWNKFLITTLHENIFKPYIKTAPLTFWPTPITPLSRSLFLPSPPPNHPVPLPAHTWALHFPKVKLVYTSCVLTLLWLYVCSSYRSKSKHWQHWWVDFLWVSAEKIVLNGNLRLFHLTSTFCNLSKQCRHWSDAAFCGVWSGSARFANAPALRRVQQSTQKCK